MLRAECFDEALMFLCGDVTQLKWSPDFPELLTVDLPHRDFSRGPIHFGVEFWRNGHHPATPFVERIGKLPFAVGERNTVRRAADGSPPPSRRKANARS